MGGATLSKSLIQFFCLWLELCSLPAIYLVPSYGRGNEDSGDLSQKNPQACTAALRAPNPAADHHRPTPSPETPRHPQASLLWGH